MFMMNHPHRQYTEIFELKLNTTQLSFNLYFSDVQWKDRKVNNLVQVLVSVINMVLSLFVNTFNCNVNLR